MKKQIYLTPAEGKRLIAKTLAADEEILKIAREHTLVITTGTTDGYVGEEICKKLGIPGFEMETFYSGVFMGPEGVRKAADKDFVIKEGKHLPGEDIYTIAPGLTSEDMILKGGNALYMKDRQVGVYIGNLHFGKLSPIVTAVYGRRTRLLMPIGLEKRIDCPVTEAVRFVDAADNEGLRLAYAPGEPFTEIDALETLGVTAKLVGAGGVGGFEGSIILGIEGPEEAMRKVDALLSEIKGEKRYGVIPRQDCE